MAKYRANHAERAANAERKRRQREADRELKAARARESQADTVEASPAGGRGDTLRLARPGDWGHAGKAEMVLVRTACNKQWPIPDAVRGRVLERTYNALNSEHERHSLMAANTFVAMDRLNLTREELDQRNGLGGDFTLADLVAEGERRALEYRPEERPHGTMDAGAAID